MSEKRRKARIQGGWAAPGTKTDKRTGSGKARAASCASSSVSNLGTACLTRTIDVPIPRKDKFVFEPPEEEIKEKPKVKVIDKYGVYDLSSCPNGVSRVRLFPKFIDTEECSWIFEQLFQELPWKQRMTTRNGVTKLQPRLTAWFGDFPYSYSGITHNANAHWSPILTMLKDRLEEVTGLKFNSMLANLYRDGHDSVDWHSDDEPSLGKNPTIASISFGETRLFELRKKPPESGDCADYAYMQHVLVPLTSGSLLIMEGTTQEEWQHRVPREYHDKEARVNLTFRVIYPT